ncbi:MAG: hypothetical protein KIS96_10710 [Bauldia sp.]|nr:hypothetical protein [Bauldia sp.]
MDRPDLTLTPEEAEAIDAVVARAVAIARGHGMEDIDPLALRDDLAAVHLGSTALRLDDLAGADPLDLVHDVFGIRRHLDRRTGALRGFAPRFRAERA